MRTIKHIQHILVAMVAICTTLFSSCSVHEWPTIDPERPYPFVLHLDYSTELPLYKVIEHTASRAAAAAGYDVRYTVEAYAAEPMYGYSANQLVKRQVYTFDDVETLNRDLTFELALGHYNIFVWTDYVEAGKEEHLFYNTDLFRGIIYNGPHEGCNDFRDAFVGSLEAEITELTTDLNISNERPLAKFNLVTTDFDRFVQHILELEAERAEAEAEAEKNKEQDEPQQEAGIDRMFFPTLVMGDNIIAVGNPSRVVDLNDYRVVVKYMSNMPNEFHVMRNEPIDAAPAGSVSFECDLRILNDTEAELGFDYVMVSKNQMMVRVAVEVYDYRNEKISTSKVIDVPLVRSHLTTIRANFLTAKSTGGVGIDPSFEGPDHIHYID